MYTGLVDRKDNPAYVKDLIQHPSAGDAEIARLAGGELMARSLVSGLYYKLKDREFTIVEHRQ